MVKYSSIPISRIGKVVTGRTPKTSDPSNYGSEFMFIGPSDLHKHYIIKDSDKMISLKGLRSIESSVINGKSVLVGCIGWDMGNVALVEDKCATNQQINSITDFKSEYNPYYIYYWLSGKKDYLFQQASVTRTPILNKSTFSNIEIPIPSRDYQDDVATILRVLDKKISLNNRVNAELEAMAKLIYDYWFVQFDFPDENGRPYKSSGGKMVYNEELKREIPEGWGVEPLISAMDVQYGFPFSTKLFSEEKNGKAVVRIRDISKGTVSAYSSEHADDKYRLEQKDLVIGMDGNFHMNFWSKNNCWLNQRCLRVRKAPDSKLSTFQVFYMIEPFIKAREKSVSRTTVGHLSAKDINDLKVIVPDSKVKLEHQNYFDCALDKIVLNRNENRELASLRDWLLPMLMNGQVKVGEVKEYEKGSEVGVAAERKTNYTKTKVGDNG